MPRIKVSSVTRFFEEFLELGCKAFIFDELPLAIREGRGVWTGSHTAEQGLQVSDWVHCWIIVPRDGYQHVARAEVVGLAMSQVDVDHVVDCIHSNVSTNKYFIWIKVG